MQLDFSNQYVIVTGGTRGIGKGLVKSFLESGATVVATYAGNTEAASRMKEEFAQYGDKVVTKQFDVSDPQAVKDFYSWYETQYSRLDVLVNNSGIRKDNIAASMTQLEWQQVLNTNLSGSFFMAQSAILLMMKNRYGRIINMSSVGGALGLSGQSNYAASKAGQVAIAKSISKEVAKRNITINCVCPGFIETELIGDLAPELVEEYKKQVPLKRFGKVEEVAAAVLFLASKQASYITGTTIDVDGGL